MGHPMRLELIREVLQVELANHYLSRSIQSTYVFLYTGLIRNKQVVMDQFNYSQKRYDRLIHNGFIMICSFHHIILMKRIIWNNLPDLKTKVTANSAGKKTEIRRLHLYRGVRSLPTNEIWHSTIWCWGFSSGASGNVKYTFIAITPKSTLTPSGSTC